MAEMVRLKYAATSTERRQRPSHVQSQRRHEPAWDSGHWTTVCGSRSYEDVGTDDAARTSAI